MLLQEVVRDAEDDKQSKGGAERKGDLLLVPDRTPEQTGTEKEKKATEHRDQQGPGEGDFLELPSDVSGREAVANLLCV
jgi:hypothetical protein